MNRIEKKYGYLDVLAMVPETGLESIVYVLEPVKVLPMLERFISDGTAVVSVFGMDWNRDLTPWPAKGVLKKGGDFTGKADGFMDLLLETIIPETESALGIPAGSRVKRILAGVSLAGMFAVYASLKTDAFNAVGSVSGSFWYDNFTKYLKNEEPKADRYYLSIGEQEKNAKNPRLACSEIRTREVESFLRGKGKEVTFELTEGGHFTDGPARVAKAISVLLFDI